MSLLFGFCFVLNSELSCTLLQSDVKPETSGCNELRYNLDADTIGAIFKTYPAGKQRLDFLS